MTTSIAIKIDRTVYVIDPTQIRWFEYNERYSDLTLFYHNGALETIRHLYHDLRLQFNILDVKEY